MITKMLGIILTLNAVSFSAEASFLDLFRSPKADNSKLHDLVTMQEQKVIEYADRRMFGEKLDTKEPYQWTTFKQFGRDVANFRGGLSSIGVSKGDSIAIIATNSSKWAVAAYASFSLGASIAPMYLEQKDDEVIYKINDCGAKIVVVESEEVKKRIQSFAEKIPNVKDIISLKKTAEGLTYASLLDEGKRRPTPSIKVDPKSLATLIYTSGTTGKPKGVRLTHENLMGLLSRMNQAIDISGESSVSFLTWAHIFGQLAELHALILYGNSAAFVQNKDTLVDNMREVNPTILFSVPLMFTSVAKKFTAKIESLPEDDRTKRAYRRWLRYQKSAEFHLLDPIYSELFVLNAKKLIFGSRLKYAVSGGGKLDENASALMSGLKIKVRDAYGLSETGGIVSMNTIDVFRAGSVGKPFPGVEVVIRVPENPADIIRIKVGDKEITTGEILVKGPAVMSGYHNRPQDTAEAFTSDGYYRTGDSGYLDQDNFLFITGRTKELYKLSNGKYIAPAVFENEAKGNALFSEAFMHGNSDQNFSIAVLQVNVQALQAIALKLGVEPNLENEQIKAYVAGEFKKICDSIDHLNAPKKFYATTDEWSVKNGLLTPSFKLKRKLIQEKYAEQIADMYK